MAHPHSTPHPRCIEVDLPRIEAILAGTLALMTGHAQAACPVRRRQMAHRIDDNLGLLSAAALSPAFATTVGQLRMHWQRLADPAAGRPWAEEVTATHPAPGALQ